MQIIMSNLSFYNKIHEKLYMKFETAEKLGGSNYQTTERDNERIKTCLKIPTEINESTKLSKSKISRIKKS